MTAQEAWVEVPYAEDFIFVPVMVGPKIKAWPSHASGGQARYIPLRDALTAKFDTDAHFAAYSCPTIPRRLDAAALGRPDARITMVVDVFDIDCSLSHKSSGGDGKIAASDAWWEGEKQKISLLQKDHDKLFVYRTRGGYRLLGVRDSPMVIAAEANADLWKIEYVKSCAYLAGKYGIEPDPRCFDWQHIFRLPRATREGSASPENLATIGDPDDLGTWVHAYDATRDGAAALALAEREIAAEAAAKAKLFEEISQKMGVPLADAPAIAGALSREEKKAKGLTTQVPSPAWPSKIRFLGLTIERPKSTKNQSAAAGKKSTAGATETTPHDVLKALVCKLRGSGLERDELLTALREKNATLPTPRPDEEIVRLVDWAVKTLRARTAAEWDLFSDQGNASAILDAYGDTLLDTHERGWMHYADGVWTHDTKKPVHLAATALRKLAADKIECGATVKEIGYLLTRKAVANALALAGPQLAIRIEKFDADPWVMNTGDGTLNLRTGDIRQHAPTDYCTKKSTVKFDPNATSPTWDKCLQTWLPDAEVRAFIQRLVGYWITGKVQEHISPVFYGVGANGKTTFLEAIQHIMGTYARAVLSSLLMERDREAHPTERAQLLGLRLAVASESKQHRHLDEATVKILTGGDRVSARFMHKDFFEFCPTHKLVLSTNHKPIIKGCDEGIWRRVLLIPWGVVVPKAQRDRALGDSLKREASGILRWAIDGSLMWQRDGLCPPTAVIAATNAFRAASDIVGRFLAERCTSTVPAATTAAGVLMTAFEMWCRETGEKPISQRALSEDLLMRGFTKRVLHGRHLYVGVGLLDLDRMRAADGQGEPGDSPDVF